MGFPLEECEQAYAYMKPDIRESLHEQMVLFGSEYGLMNLTYPSIRRVTNYGLGTTVTAADLVRAPPPTPPYRAHAPTYRARAPRIARAHPTHTRPRNAAARVRGEAAHECEGRRRTGAKGGGARVREEAAVAPLPPTREWRRALRTLRPQ